MAVANQEEGRREFASGHVAKALLIDQVNPDGMTLWLHLNKEEAGIPLTKTLEAQTEAAPAQYQFKHLSFQEGLCVHPCQAPPPSTPLSSPHPRPSVTLPPPVNRPPRL